MNTPSSKVEGLPSDKGEDAPYRGSCNVKIFMRVNDPVETFGLDLSSLSRAPEEDEGQNTPK